MRQTKSLSITKKYTVASARSLNPIGKSLEAFTSQISHIVLNINALGDGKRCNRALGLLARKPWQDAMDKEYSAVGAERWFATCGKTLRSKK